MTRLFIRPCLAVFLSLVSLPSLFGTTYTFTKIVDNGPGTPYFLTAFPTFVINSKGEVAFTGVQTANGIYIGSGGAIATVAADDTTRFTLTGFNDSGTVVYEGRGSVNTNTAGGTPFVVGPINGSSTIYPAINNNGTVAFGSLNTSILIRTGSAPVQTLISDTDLPRSNQLAAPFLSGLSINNAGTVAFYANDIMSGAGCNCGTYTKSQNALTLMAPYLGGFSHAPQINDSGAVAFMGTYQTTKGVFVASNGQVGAVVDLTSQTVSLGDQYVSLNNKGQVAYFAKFDISPFTQGIFTGADKVADRVIANGDPLFGSVVESIGTSQFGGRFLNDKGQVAFSYRLSNGLQGLAVATPVASNTPPPTLADNGILNGASFAPGAPASPGSIVSIFGANFIDQLAVPPGDPLPTSLKGVSVTFNGFKAPLFFVAPGQINAQVPFEVTGSSATVQVSNPAGTSNTQVISMVPETPAIFTTAQNGVGQGIVVFANTATIVAPVKPGTNWRPAKVGDTITIYANGLGAVTPAVNDGWNSCDKSICAPDLSNLTLRRTTVRPKITIGGVTVPDNMIEYSGLTPQFAGLYQINVTIPSGVQASNSVPIVIQMGNTSSPQDVSIGMQ
jgi:uncharacterized protein (TIGR03437 family)